MPVSPLPLIHPPITLSVESLTMKLVLNEVAFILPTDIPFPDEFSLAFHALVDPISFVNSTILPLIPTTAVYHVVHKVTGINVPLLKVIFSLAIAFVIVVGADIIGGVGGPFFFPLAFFDAIDPVSGVGGIVVLGYFPFSVGKTVQPVTFVDFPVSARNSTAA